MLVSVGETDVPEDMEHVQSIFRRWLNPATPEMEDDGLTADPAVMATTSGSPADCPHPSMGEGNGDSDEDRQPSQMSRLDALLLEAAASGHSTDIHRLWRAGADVNIAGNVGKTALYLASELNQLDTAHQLLQVPECDIRKSDSNGWTPLHAAAYKGHVEVIDALISTDEGRWHTSGPELTLLADLEDEEKRTPLHLAAETNHMGALQRMIQSHADTDKRDLEGLTPLITAASSGHLAAVQVLCSAGCDLDERNNEGRTALMEATSGGHLDVLRHLVQAGCHVNVMDCHGVTALADAAAGDSVVAVEELIAAGADTDEQDSRGRTPLHVATLYGHREVADRLVRARCSLDTQDQDGFTPTFLAAWDPWQKGTDTILEQLALEGADLNLPDALGITPIVKAWDNKDHVMTLIRYGCHVTVSTSHGFTLAELAAMQGDFPMVRMLLAGGFDSRAIDFQKSRPKYQAEYAKLAEICQSPLSLKDSCRLTIRRCLPRPVNHNVPALPIPPLLKQFLTFHAML